MGGRAPASSFGATHRQLALKYASVHAEKERFKDRIDWRTYREKSSPEYCYATNRPRRWSSKLTRAGENTEILQVNVTCTLMCTEVSRIRARKQRVHTRSHQVRLQGNWDPTPLCSTTETIKDLTRDLNGKMSHSSLCVQSARPA